MNQNLAEISWPAEQLGEAFALLARHTGSTRCNVQVPPPPQFGPENAGPQERWIEAAASRLELEAEPVEVPYADVDQFLVAASPALGAPFKQRINAIFGPARSSSARVVGVDSAAVCGSCCNYIRASGVVQPDRRAGGWARGKYVASHGRPRPTRSTSEEGARLTANRFGPYRWLLAAAPHGMSLAPYEVTGLAVYREPTRAKWIAVYGELAGAAVERVQRIRE